jgi:anti-sigma factor RsiW
MIEKNFEHELTAFIDGELEGADRRALEQALDADPALRSLEKRLRKTVALMARVPAPAPSVAMKRAVLDRLVSVPSAAPPTPSWFSMPRLLPFAALAAAAGLAAVVLTRSPPIRPPAVDDEQVMLAQNLELVEDLDLDGLSSPEDLEVVEQLSQLEQTP